MNFSYIKLTTTKRLYIRTFTRTKVIYRDIDFVYSNSQQGTFSWLLHNIGTIEIAMFTLHLIKIFTYRENFR